MEDLKCKSVKSFDAFRFRQDKQEGVAETSVRSVVEYFNKRSYKINMTENNLIFKQWS